MLTNTDSDMNRLLLASAVICCAGCTPNPGVIGSHATTDGIASPDRDADQIPGGDTDATNDADADPVAIPVSDTNTDGPLPVLLIDVNGMEIDKGEKIPGSLRVVEDHDGTLTGILTRPTSLESLIGIEHRGEFSLKFDKKSYSMELRDAEGNDLKMPFIGMPAESDWVLRAGTFDHTLMRDALGFSVFNEIFGHYAPRFRFVEVFLDGDYIGVYLACERIKRGRHRVALPKVAPNAASGDISGGYILHIESNSGGEAVTTASGLEWEFNYPHAKKITPGQRAYLDDFLNRFETAMSEENFNNPPGAYTEWVDFTAAVDYALFQELARNTDGYKKSSYYQKLPDAAGGKLINAPIWDHDLAFGNYENGTHEPEGWLYEFDWNDKVPWWGRFWTDPAFLNGLRCRWQELRAGPLTTNAIDAKLDRFTDLIVEAQKRENERWDLIGREERRAAYVGETWMEDIAYLKGWVATRITWLDGALAGACQP
jgi:hypothetical protein